MARTVIGYFSDQSKAFKLIERFMSEGYDPQLIHAAFEEKPVKPVKKMGDNLDYDNTIEQAPVIAFKELVFGADITEEDAKYYSKLLKEGDTLIAIYVPTNEEEGRDWEEKAAKNFDSTIGKAGAYDHEIRKIYSNRPGLTTYPQNRYLDPVGPNNPNRDSIYDSRSPLNGEVSNVIGVSDPNEDYFQEVEQLGGRKILTGAQITERENLKKAPLKRRR